MTTDECSICCVPLKDAVAQLVAKDEPVGKLSRTESQQQRRLDAIPNPKL